jgi:uncharacterized protein (DUF58 family)
VKLTRAGLAVSLVAFALLLAAAVFRDFFVGAAVLVLAVAIAAEASWVALATRRPQSRFTITTGEAQPRERTMTHPGEESVERLYLTKKVGGKLGLASHVNFMRIEPPVLRGTGRLPLELRFKTEYAGEYRADEVGATVTGPIGLFSSETAIPLAQRYVVYPRVLQVAAATVKLLGRGELGETPIDMPGIGSEYYEMRGYQPGDDYRNVNWKASARQGELIVTERMREVGASFLLVLDARAPGFADADRLASTFLSIANSLASSGISFGILVHDGEKVTALSPEQDPGTSLGLALKSAVEITKVGSTPEYLELMPVRLAARIAAIPSEANNEASVWQLQGLRAAQVRSTVEHDDPWAAAAGYIRERSVRSVTYVSGLFNKVEPLIQLAWEARHYRDVEFTVADPCLSKAEPGLAAEELEALTRQRKLVSALGKAGVPCYTGRPEDLVRRIFGS